MDSKKIKATNFTLLVWPTSVMHGYTECSVTVVNGFIVYNTTLLNKNYFILFILNRTADCTMNHRFSWRNIEFIRWQKYNLFYGKYTEHNRNI